MDAIRKKMQSLKVETDSYQLTTANFEAEAKAKNDISDKADAEIRDLQKKITNLEGRFDESFEKLTQTSTQEEEKTKTLLDAEDDVNNLSRRLLLLEEECKRRDFELASTTMDLCKTSKTADATARKCKVLQSKNLTDEVLLEGLDAEVREATYMKDDGEKKLDEITRRDGVMEDELKRATERATLAEEKNVSLEEQLRNVGENMKQLEVSEEKALEREERFKEQIRALMMRLKEADKRAEYGEMNITKLNIRIDDMEDEIVREKMKIKHISNELSDTFDDMLTRY